MRVIKKHWVFLSLLFLGLFIRLVFMHYQGLSNDELSAWHRTHLSSWNDFWVQGVKIGDMHPAFYQVLLWIWVRVFGDSEFALRSTSLLFYIFTSLLVYRIGLQHFSKFSALLFQALYVGLAFTIMNTVFARPYNSGVFFLLLTFYGLLELKSQKNQLWKWTLLVALGLLGSMLSHYFAFLTGIVISFLGLFYLGKSKFIYLLASGVIAILLFLPHLPITLFQVGRGGLGWLAAPKLSWPIDFVHLFFNESWFLTALLALLFGVCVFFAKRNWNATSTFSISIFVVGFIGAFALSHLFTPILREIVMQFLLPFLFLPLFYLIELKSEKIKTGLIFFVALVPTRDSFYRYQLVEPVHYGVFKEIGEAINAANDQHGRQNITYAANFNNVDYINYYVDKDLTETIIDWDQPEALNLLIDRAKNAKTKYFGYAYSNKFHVPMFLEAIRCYFPEVVSTVKTRYSIFVLFKKSNKLRNFGHPINAVVSTQMKQTQDEFSMDGSMEVKDLPQLKNNWDYYYLKCETEIMDTIPLFLTVTVQRNGDFWKRGDDLAVYYSYDQRLFADIGERKNMICPFVLPDDILTSDQLKFYIWNPNKGKYSANQIRVFTEKLR